MIDAHQIIIQALIIGACSAVLTAFISSIVINVKLKALEQRLTRIEHYLNGLLKNFKDDKE